VHDLIGDLAGLRGEFPGYRFEIARTWHGLSLAAARIGPGDGPLVVVTADASELRECLAARAREHAGRPARGAGSPGLDV